MKNEPTLPKDIVENGKQAVRVPIGWKLMRTGKREAPINGYYYLGSNGPYQERNVGYMYDNRSRCEILTCTPIYAED